MKLAFIGTGKIIADALFAIEPIKEIEKTAILPDLTVKKKQRLLQNSIISLKFILTMKNCLQKPQQIRFISVLLTVLTIPMQNRHFFTGKMSSLKNLLLAFIMRHRNCSRLQKRINYLFLRL